ncbi:MAG: hypothetical protein BM557_02520 [Flavobacterium sp. MedPE-SWcel]|uniref:DUF4296 domain-containing protein n=1 Tax=uncultured Flavobacterium sp. TaxID=165435 RepID=UPI00091CB05F|nr:DUF4296 domain-containing protein [uncultured Flavobacterium sp.]OIQ21691.1 MAG: hypothetical protein BM557_02520 [Flavobacterium sp. MedPE-SWcel]
MKKIAFLVLMSLSLFACKKGEEKIEEPKPLLSEDKMVDVLYDVNMLQSMQSFKPKTLADNKVDPVTYVYNKYDIDSATFAENHIYYASQLDVYERIHKRVSERVKKEKEAIEEILEAEAKADSIEKAKEEEIKIKDLKPAP